MATFDLTLPDTTAGDADDGEENQTAGTWNSKITTAYPQGQYFTVGNKIAGNDYNGGVRFENITIPNSATISSATLRLGYESNVSTQNITVYGDAVDSAAAWSNTSRPSSGFTNTTASASTTSPTAGPTFDITITSIVQELVNRAGWASGNNMRFAIFHDAAASYGARILFEDVDVGTGDTLQRPELIVTYSAGGATWLTTNFWWDSY